MARDLRAVGMRRGALLTMRSSCSGRILVGRDHLTGLTVLLAASLALLVHASYVAIPVIAQAASAKASAQEADAVRELMQDDPALGSKVEMNGLRGPTGDNVVVPPTGKYTAVLFVASAKTGGCTACSTTDHIGAIDRLADSASGLNVYVVWAGQHDLRGMPAGSLEHKAVRFAVDPNLDLCRRLNVVFFPRAYLLSPDSKLLYLSTYRAPERTITRAILSAITQEKQRAAI